VAKDGNLDILNPSNFLDIPNLKDFGVTMLAMECRRISHLVTVVNWDNERSEDFKDEWMLVFLQMMSSSICNTLNKQSGCEDIAGFWSELSLALEDVCSGKSAELFRPRKAEESQPQRISARGEMYLSVAAAVYHLAIRGTKKEVAEKIAKALKIKPSRIIDFKKNLTRGKPNITSASANTYFDAVVVGTIKVNEDGRLRPGTGVPSPIANWLKFFQMAEMKKV
jgi:hypothetical protein